MTTDQALTVGLVQINNDFSGTFYFPYSVGLLQAYATKYLSRAGAYSFLPPIYRRTPVSQAMQHLDNADIVGFSVYVWNIAISIEIAKALKAKHPEVLIVFGGPQVPNQAESFLREHGFIDLVCHGEGEQVFAQILEDFPGRQWQTCPSVSYLENDGRFTNTPRAPRLKELSLVPSPYLEGVFDSLLEERPCEDWLGLWETNRGCPFACTFCDWGSATNAKVNVFDIDRLKQEVDWFAQHRIKYVLCCDANFGILARDLDITQYVADRKSMLGYPHRFAVFNTKNVTERSYAVQVLLAAADLTTGMSIALQSMDIETLKNVKRNNISLESFMELQVRFTKAGVTPSNDIIIGLPGETYESFVEGVSTLIERGQHNSITFHNLTILPNSEMGDLEYQMKFGIEWVKSRIDYAHGSILPSEDGISEFQQVVVATHSMPREDWLRTRVFCWMTCFLHFNKVLQIPFICLHETCSVSYRYLIELFCKNDLAAYPVLEEIQRFFALKAAEIQRGGEEFCASPDWLDTWWHADQHVFIRLAKERKFHQLYQEAEEMLFRCLTELGLDIPADLLHESIEVNRHLLRLPFQSSRVGFELSYPIMDCFENAKRAEPYALKKGLPASYVLHRPEWNDFDRWCREVVWYGHRSGTYLHPSDHVEHVEMVESGLYLAS